jgi:hypothetical protein
VSEADVFELYKSLDLWKNSTCKACQAICEAKGLPLSGPISIWQVGEAFNSDERRLMFVGKTARGQLGTQEEAEREISINGFVNGTFDADSMFADKSWPYWSYVAECLVKLYGSADAGWSKIAFTNMVKCNTSSTIDNLPYAIKQNCIDELSVIWRELEILRPKNVILFTHTDYDDHIERYTAGLEVREITKRSSYIPNGKKRMIWWEREYHSMTGLNFRLLRTSHPERQKKESFVANIVAWVRGESPLALHTDHGN